jgi:hypothetical protein
VPELWKEGAPPAWYAMQPDQVSELRDYDDKGTIGTRGCAVELVLYSNPILRTHAVPVERVGRTERRLLSGA